MSFCFKPFYIENNCWCGRNFLRLMRLSHFCGVIHNNVFAILILSPSITCLMSQLLFLSLILLWLPFCHVNYDFGLADDCHQWIIITPQACEHGYIVTNRPCKLLNGFCLTEGPWCRNALNVNYFIVKFWFFFICNCAGQIKCKNLTLSDRLRSHHKKQTSGHPDPALLHIWWQTV